MRSRTIVSWSLRRGLSALLLCVLALTGCDTSDAGAAPGQPVAGDLFSIDPDMMLFDEPRFERFDGHSSSLLLVDGWGSRGHSPKSRVDAWGNACWVVGKSASIEFEAPVPSGVDFFARCRPMVYPDAPTQEVRLMISKREIGRASLKPGWQDLRISLAAGVFDAPWNRLEVSFSQTARPSEVLGTRDDRALSVVFNCIALVPSSLARGSEQSVIRAAQVSESRLVLPVGTTVHYPLPAARGVGLTLGGVESACGGCGLTFRAGRSIESAEVLWQGRADDVPATPLDVPCESDRPTRLWVSATHAGVLAPGDRHDVKIDFPADALRVDRSTTADGPPSVFVYLVDTLRADVLGPYGGHDVSPRIDALATESVVYARTWSTSSWTLPATASLLTGVYPFLHGATDGARGLGEETPTMASYLARHGYRSVSISHSHVVSQMFGFHSGFDEFLFSNRLNGKDILSQQVRGLLSDWLTRQPDDKPVLAYLHTVDPHAPYCPVGADLAAAERVGEDIPLGAETAQGFLDPALGGDADRVARLKALYEGEVRYADRQFGRFLDMLAYMGLYDDSLIAFVSDHGEAFGEHENFGHGRTLMEEQLRVPLIVRYPGAADGGSVVQRRVSTLDVLPTVLSVTGADAAGQTLHGQPLPRSDEPGVPSWPLFAQVKAKANQIHAAVEYDAVVVESIKSILNHLGTDHLGRQAPEWLDFDLEHDPGEEVPLSEDAPQVREIQALLESWVSNARAVSARNDEQVDGDDAGRLDVLRELGYVR